MSKTLSIAVLPFANMSNKEDSEFFADGMTEEIINALTRIPELKITSRTSSFFYKNKNIPVSVIGQELGVHLILEGSVRFGGNKVRITAQLIQAEEDYHLFSETWDRSLDDVFQVQDDVSLLIADRIRENFGHFEITDHLANQGTRKVDAYEFCLKGKYHKNKWSVEDAKIAKRFFEKSLEIDPEFTDAMIGLADVYSFLGMVGAMSFEESWTKCNDLIEKALVIDPKHPEAFYQKGHSALFKEVNFSKALEYANLAIQYKPNYAEAQQLMSFLHEIS
ncbi:MAG: hypothetical protein HRT74_12060, partial [Flavobacteriales bacterium]|nr:hypothetical protein [Flavobacteriales bacterium]